MGLLDWFLDQFRPTEIHDLRLSVRIDRTADGQHLIRFFKQLGGREEPVVDLAPLLRYGYREEVEGPKGPIIYAITEKDRQILLAVKSMNPVLGDGGTLRFDFAPAILKYLRTQDNLDETKASERLQIRDEPPQPGMTVDLAPHGGLIVKTGYVDEDGQGILPAESFTRTADGQYMFGGDSFYRLPKNQSQQTEKLLRTPTSKVPIDRVPKFLQRELDTLDKDFSIGLSDNVRQIKIVNDPIQPTAVIDYDPDLGLTVESGYDLGDGEVISPGLLPRTSDGAYVIDQGAYYALPKHLRGDESESALVRDRVIPKERIPNFLKQQMELLLNGYSIRLSDSAKQIKIQDKPLKPLARIAYDSQKGLDIETGYLVDDNLVPAVQLPVTTDLRHAVFGTNFVPLPENLTDAAEYYLNTSRHKVPKKEIPGFFSWVLPHLENAFTVELADSTGAIQIFDEPLKPVAVIDFDQQTGLDVQIGYSIEGGESLLSDGELSKTADGRYAIFGDTFSALPSDLDPKARAYLQQAKRQIPTENTPEFFEQDLNTLKQAFETEMTAEAQKIRIVDEPLKPTARVDYDPHQGLSIQTGYVIDDSDELVADSELWKTADGKYAIFDDTFLALPSDLDGKAKAYLKQARRQIPTEKVPKFFEQDLRPLKQAFETEMTAEAQKIQIVDEPLKPIARIDFDPEQGLSVQTGYALDDTEELVADSELRKTADGKHYINDYTFTALPSNLGLQGQTLLARPHHRIPLEDTPTFLHELSSLQGSFTGEWTDAAGQIEIIDEPLRPAARVDFDPQQGLTVQTGYDIGNTGQITPADQLRMTSDGKYVIAGDTFRALPDDLSHEAQNWLENPYHEISINNVPEFFLRDLLLLRNEFSAVLTAPAQEIRIIEDQLQPVVTVNKQEGGWLDFNVGYEAGGAWLPPGLMTSKTGETYVQAGDSTWVKVDRAVAAEAERELAELDAELTSSGYRLPITRFASLEEFIESIGGTAEVDQAYQEFLDQLSGFKADETFQLSARAEIDLAHAGISMRPYQRAGVHWLDWLYTNHLHGVLADDMGLGKTLQTICVMRRAYEQSHTRQHSLILAPKSVLYHWERELKRFYPLMRVYRYHGPFRNRKLLRSIAPITFLTTYSTAANDLSDLVEVPFFYLVLDEATYIKNPDTNRSRAVKSLNAAHRLALTGTPVENRPAELWSLFDFLMRDHLGKYGTFKREFEERIMAGDHQTSKKLGKRVGPFMLRRTKGEVAKDLPEKIEIDEWCGLTQEQRKLYGGLQGQVKRVRKSLQAGEYVNFASSILPILTKLKQICDHPGIVTNETVPLKGRSEKFDWITQKIDEIYRAGEQTVIFSHFLGMLDFLETAVRQKGIQFIRIDGSTNNRQQLIDRFNEGRAQVALCSILAAGHGINMTAANNVIHADRWWNPAREDQATDRVHRIGQDKTVYVYRILVEGTIEERIDNLLDKKRDLADQIVGAATEGPRQWSREELIELLSPLDEGPQARESRPREVRRRKSPSVGFDVKKPVDEPPPPERSPRLQPKPEIMISKESLAPKTTQSPKPLLSLSDQLVHIMKLSEQGDEPAIQELVNTLVTPDNNIRWLAGSSLIRIGGPQTVMALTSFLKRNDVAEVGQLEAIKVLGKIGSPQAQQVLRQCADNSKRAGSVSEAADRALQTFYR